MENQMEIVSGPFYSFPDSQWCAKVKIGDGYTTVWRKTRQEMEEALSGAKKINS